MTLLVTVAVIRVQGLNFRKKVEPLYSMTNK